MASQFVMRVLSMAILSFCPFGPFQTTLYTVSRLILLKSNIYFFLSSSHCSLFAEWIWTWGTLVVVILFTELLLTPWFSHLFITKTFIQEVLCSKDTGFYSECKLINIPLRHIIVFFVKLFDTIRIDLPPTFSSAIL